MKKKTTKDDPGVVAATQIEKLTSALSKGRVVQRQSGRVTPQEGQGRYESAMEDVQHGPKTQMEALNALTKERDASLPRFNKNLQLRKTSSRFRRSSTTWKNHLCKRMQAP